MPRSTVTAVCSGQVLAGGSVLAPQVWHTGESGTLVNIRLARSSVPVLRTLNKQIVGIIHFSCPDSNLAEEAAVGVDTGSPIPAGVLLLALVPAKLLLNIVQAPLQCVVLHSNQVYISSSAGVPLPVF